MLNIYGFPLSSPTNKVRYVANYLEIPYKFHLINLAQGEHLKPEFLKINPYGRIPCIENDSFRLAESNAIIRYLSDMQQSALYPVELKARAIVDQWIDYGSQHVLLAAARIMFNTYFYKFAKVQQDERAIQDGIKYLGQYLPVVNNQLSQHAYITGETITLADFVLIAALDVAELIHLDLAIYPHISEWRTKLMHEPFYQKTHESYTVTFQKIVNAEIA